MVDIPTGPPNFGTEILSAWQRLLLALNELVIHMVGALAVVASIEVMDWIIGLMTHQEGVMFFRSSKYFAFPARWMFDAADMGILLAILYRGVIVMWKVYREPKPRA
jgi:hypothetical protein